MLFEALKLLMPLLTVLRRDRLERDWFKLRAAAVSEFMPVVVLWIWTPMMSDSASFPDSASKPMLPESDLRREWVCAWAG